jgi:hypothetical protein
MAVNTNSVYLFTSSSTFPIPTGVTAVQIECFGASVGANYYTFDRYNITGASYSKIYNFDVSSGTTLTVTIGGPNNPDAGDVWVSNTGSKPTSISQGCLALGGGNITNGSLKTPAYQNANNIGNVIFAGGSGLVNSSYWIAAGGNAGPNGPGGNVGLPYTLSSTFNPVTLCGGGANGGSTGGSGFLPYGRLGSGGTIGAGSGGYTASSSQPSSTRDVLGQASYLNNVIQNSLVSYGPYGGNVAFANCVSGCTVQTLGGNNGFAVITLIYPIKYIVVTQTGQSSFTMPSDCTGISSAIAIGAGGNGGATNTLSAGGGGGGGYSESVDITPANGTTVVGGTTVWCQVPTGGSGSTAYIKFGGATNIPPIASAQGVLANSGGNGTTAGVGGLGGSTTGAIGSTTPTLRTKSGGNGGAGSTTGSQRNHGGGGGPGAKVLGSFYNGSAGGAGLTGSTSKGHGGGGTYINVGNGGGASAGGDGGNTGLGSGGTGATSTTSATAGTGGGGGGGFGNITQYGSVGSPITVLGNVYPLGSGSGGNAAASSVINYGGGGGGGTTAANVSGGQGILIIAYTTNAYAPPKSNGNFLQFI